MRIIAGRARGRKLRAPRGLTTRPLLDRAREALFSILGPQVEGARILDLYAGTGSLGLEALSRGAKRCTFVERSRPALVCLRRNIEELGFESCARVAAQPVAAFLGDLTVCFQVIFLDPPYAHLRAGGGRRAALLATARRLCRQHLSAGGRLVFHLPRDLLDGSEIEGIAPAELRNYGTSTLAIFTSSAGGT